MLPLLRDMDVKSYFLEFSGTIQKAHLSKVAEIGILKCKKRSEESNPHALIPAVIWGPTLMGS